MEENDLPEFDKYQDSVLAILIGLIIIGGGAVVGFAWLLILSIIRG
jgi:hypothetical protein